MRHSRSPQRIFDDFNRRYFRGQLPRFVVRKDLKSGTDAARCDPETKRIHLPVDIDDVEAVILHEMIHAVTEGNHHDAFRAELRRIASLGDAAAIRELTIEEWHASTERVGVQLAREESHLSAGEVRKRIIKVVGDPLCCPNGFPARGMAKWLKERWQH